MCEMNEANCEAVMDIQKIKSDVNDIKNALLGNEYNKGKGLVNVTQDHEERLTKLEKNWVYVTGFAAASGVIIGVVIQVIIQVIVK